jgi:hypothetical protein
MHYAGEIRSRGLVEEVDGGQVDASFAVCALLRRDWDRGNQHHQRGTPEHLLSTGPVRGLLQSG